MTREGHKNTHIVNHRIRRDIIVTGQFRKRQTAATALIRIGFRLWTRHEGLWNTSNATNNKLDNNKERQWLQPLTPRRKQRGLGAGRKSGGTSERNEAQFQQRQSSKGVNARPNKHNEPNYSPREALSNQKSVNNDRPESMQVNARTCLSQPRRAESMRPVSEIGETFPPENSMWKGRRGTSVDEDCQLWSAMQAR